MNRLIIVSNRLPVSIVKAEKGMKVIPSSGGLATGLKSYHKANKSVWIGWPGLSVKTTKEEDTIKTLLEREQCIPVFIDRKLIRLYYDGFSNGTIWPLFHYFTEYTEFNEGFWNSYRQVNELFAQSIIENAGQNDTVWVHDYQLMLVPAILRKKRPDLRIGFFLHIPFPSYEVFRIMPWREEIIAGILGSDLIGFHTYDYARHFLSCVRRLLGYDVEFTRIKLEKRNVYFDIFPMGIDYKKFSTKASEIINRAPSKRSKEHRELVEIFKAEPGSRIILSIDRLDYTKGISHRLKAFRQFLKDHPEYKERVTLIMLAVPSRIKVERYQELKSEVDELIGAINGELGTLKWHPVVYFYRSVPFETLIELYSLSDIALLTPLRDGMNLVAKEYVATRVDKKGVLILSEMAGATKELGEAITVNPTNIRDVSEAIFKALTISDSEQAAALSSMQRRISRYDIHKWASEFVNSLEKIKADGSGIKAKKITDKLGLKIADDFKKAQSKVLFLDYDGTLQRFFGDPKDAYPDEELSLLLRKLSSMCDMVLVSGRDKETFEKWFGKEDYTLIAEHGVWIKERNREWRERRPFHMEWKEKIIPFLESFVDRTPGSFIEEKSQSLVWHYRKSDIELGALRALELVADVSNLIVNQDLEILEGKKVVEIKVAGVNKGSAATEYIGGREIDFLLAIGDDWTDEYLFKEMPPNSFTIKVGNVNTAAEYYVDTYTDVRKLLLTLLSSNN